MFAPYIPDTTLITWYDLNTLVFGKSWLLTVITIEKKKKTQAERYISLSETKEQVRTVV